MPVDQFGSRLEERAFARIDSWTTDQRRALLAELHAMRRLEDLMSQLKSVAPANPGLRIEPRALSTLFHLHQQPARSRRFEHPSEEDDRKHEVDHVQSEAPFEMQGGKSTSLDSLPHAFE
jgi:hypothetical protein